MESTDRITVAAFAQKHGVKMSVERWHENPHMDGSENMDNWKCRLRCGRRSMVVYFSKGVGLKGTRPTLPEVLDCLASDSVGADDTFEDWAEHYGYDEDSRKAERIFNVCQKQAEKFRRLLGDAFEELLYGTQRA